MAFLPINDVTVTGTIAAISSNVQLTLSGQSGASIQITGTWVGTLQFEGNSDGVTWLPINGVSASSSTPTPTATTNGLYRLTPGGLTAFRVLPTAWTSGTATLTLKASPSIGGTFLNQIAPVTIISNPAEGVVSILNSSIATLGINGAFTGTLEDITNYSSITVGVISDVASATDGLQMQQSINGTNWDLIDSYTVPAASGKTFGAQVSAKFFRIVYSNGATIQASFRLQTIFHKFQQPASTVRPQDGRGNDNDFMETLGFLMGYNSLTNTWNRIGITNAATGGNENLIDRIKVNAALRMIDNAQPSGSKLVNLTGTQALGLDVNLKTIGITSANLGGNETTLDRLKVNASLRVIDTAQAVGSQLVGLKGDQTTGLWVNVKNSSTLAVTGTAATGTALTITLPAVAAQFHYITSLDIRLYSTAARTGAATPIIVTTTNLPGSIAFTFDTAGAIGTSVIQDLISVAPLKTSTVNTATTIVAPIVTGGIWRITATYFTGL